MLEQPEKHVTARRTCTLCEGAGIHRNNKHFFYGISLMASGFLTLFRWPPIPRMFEVVEDVAATCALPRWMAGGFLWTLTAVPMVFGIAFIVVWLLGDTCRNCAGSGKSREVVRYSGI